MKDRTCWKGAVVRCWELMRAVRVGMEKTERRVRILFEKAEGSIVNSNPAKQAVVGVEVALCIADAKPLGAEEGKALSCGIRHFEELLRKGRRRRCIIVSSNSIVNVVVLPI